MHFYSKTIPKYFHSKIIIQCTFYDKIIVQWIFIVKLILIHFRVKINFQCLLIVK